MDLLLWLLLLLPVAILVLLIIVWGNDIPKKRTRSHSKSIPPVNRIQGIQRIDRLLMGDTAARERLLQNAQIKHPDKDKDWCIDKVLRDLERDKR